MRDVLDVFDLIEAQIQTGQVDQLIESFDMADEVVVEV